MKLIIIHPGIQHSFHLANGANRSKLFEEVILFTTILFKPNQKVFWKFKKRIKPIDQKIKIHNHYLYTLLYSISKNIYNKIIINPNNQSHNNPIYFWQQIFGYFCLPHLYFNRKNTLVVCFETAGWPIVKYCKKWNIPVIMDFASISHETAKTLGINETNYGINLKIRERALIDYGFYCSEFCKNSFEGLSSAKKEFVLYLGAERGKMQEAINKNQEASSKKQDTYFVGRGEQIEETSSKNQDVYGVESVEENQDGIEMKEQRSKSQDSFNVESGGQTQEASIKNQDPKSEKKDIHEVDSSRLKIQSEEIRAVKLSFIANLEYRKGLDIFLESIHAYEYPVFLEVHLIGRIRESWVVENMPKNIVNDQVILIYRPAMSQQKLFDYLAKEQFDLNVQCSRFDSFAMVVPETMMQGIPNVVSPFVGAGEMITNGVDGFIMKDLESHSLNEILNAYIGLDDKERENLKQVVLNSSKNMVWENYYNNLDMVFKDILADLK